MLMVERHQQILEKLMAEGKVIATELCKDLNVSEDTIRRDLRKLSDDGLLQRVHGGALPTSPTPIKFLSRQSIASTGTKERLAEAAIGMMQSGQVILLDGGTTTLEIAKMLPLDLKATIITHSPPIATELCKHPTVDVITLGGKLEKNSSVAVGPSVIEALSGIHVDISFLGIACIHPLEGMTIYTMEEAFVKKKIIDCSAEVVGLASAEKLGTVTTYKVGAINNLTHLITEKNIPIHVISAFKNQGFSVTEV